MTRGSVAALGKALPSQELSERRDKDPNDPTTKDQQYQGSFSL